MKSWLPLLMLLFFAACNKPEPEEALDLNTKVSFTVQDKNGNTRAWTSNSAYAHRSKDALQLFATNEAGEQLSVLVFDTDTGTHQIRFTDDNIAKFHRIKGGKDTTYTTKKSVYASGVISVTDMDPSLSIVTGNFTIRPHYSDNNYVEIKYGEFTDVPYLSVPITQGELEISFPTDTTTIPDTLYCVRGPNCFSALIDGDPFKATGSEIYVVRDTLGRLVLTVNSGINTLKIALASMNTFEEQQIYSLGNDYPNKGYLTDGVETYYITSGTLQLNFDSDSTYSISGLLDATLWSDEASVSYKYLTDGKFMRLDVSSYARKLNNGMSTTALIHNQHVFSSDTLRVFESDSVMTITAKDFEDLEGIELQFPSYLPPGNYELGNGSIYKAYYYNYYGEKIGGFRGEIVINYFDTISRIVIGGYEFDVFDPNLTSITAGNFVLKY